jgi:hypothetical protein
MACALVGAVSALLLLAWLHDRQIAALTARKASARRDSSA